MFVSSYVINVYVYHIHSGVFIINVKCNIDLGVRDLYNNDLRLCIIEEVSTNLWSPVALVDSNQILQIPFLIRPSNLS